MAPPPPPPPAAVAEAGVLERAQAFVAENRRAVLLGAAALAAGGALAYYLAAPAAPKRRKGGKEPKKDKRAPRADAPILEERGAAADDDDVALTEAELAAMSADERADAAGKLKARGNIAYQARAYERAAALYTRAIAASPLPEPVFYSNRAACYVNMSPPQHALVIADCDVALKLDKAYVKALNRRAAAHEALAHLPEALRDFTACTILDKFQNATTAASVERVLKKLAQATAAETLAARPPRLPSYTFVSAYFAAFRARARPEVPADGPGAAGDATLLLALDALDAADYAHALTLVGEAVEQGLSTAALRARALNLRGTFKFLLADVPGAQADLEASLALDPGLTQSWVKIASVHMERGEPQAAFEAFDAAIARDAGDADIYYHRGQVLFIMNAFGDAAADYAKSTELDPAFVFSHIQLAVAQYKAEQLGKAMATFRAALREFPARSEPANYYGELLLDQGRFEEAVEKFDKAIELEAANPRQNVLPLVNKGLALFQWKNDAGAAQDACRAALAIDGECEAAVATLAQLALQQGHVAEAVDLFARQAELARSEPELVNALTYQFAARAQLQFADEYPEKASEMHALARSMM